jgi:hypothetical protein
VQVVKLLLCGFFDRSVIRFKSHFAPGGVVIKVSQVKFSIKHNAPCIVQRAAAQLKREVDNSYGLVKAHPVFFNFNFTICCKRRIETNENRRRAGGVDDPPIDESYLAFLFDYLPSPPSAPAVGAMSVVVTFAYIAAVVELLLACLCSQLCYIAKSQYKDVFTFSRS